MKPFSRSAAVLAFAFVLLIQSLTSCTKKCDPEHPPANDSVVVQMNESSWDCFRVFSQKYTAPAPGKFEFTAEGVKGFGEQYRHGCFLITTGHWDINNRTLYMKWKGNDGGQFCGFVVSLVYNGGVTNYKDLNLTSSPTSYEGSIIVSNDTWYYTSVKVTNGQYTTKTATGNYAENGGTVIENRSGTLEMTEGHISLRNGDPYAGAASYVVVNELKIK
jgi:hypothetical protein